MASEFDLIRRFFTRATPGAVLGVGDDAALLHVGSGMELAVSTDMLVSGTHFFPDTDPFSLGYKALAVNLSDMAAMAAQPRWATLALSLPEVDEIWLEKFSAGLFALADEHHVELIGGDTTRGPLNLCVTIMGEVPRGAALRRSGAQVGDDVWVSGVLGDAALALAHMQGHVQLTAKDIAACTSALHQPMPRVALGLALRGVAHCAIDISDGLLADLGHILECSNAGAEIVFAALPASSAMQLYLEQPLGKHCVLAGGDDYELCFTVSVAHRSEVEKIAVNLELRLTRIGTITAEKKCIVRAADGSVVNIEEFGYDHFR
ncbi:thiamine monophosphate kinase [Candidatus Nitrotoga sp. BS]|uniref:thiamine-phosphate kinase n=1 Tax=Candidatus Nitrotoga sp. BS TaxID=2890408 RepID=UPI001EF32A02|nr:thiamine-phosphate kinase [Candidatus Nitrotoga sp. BS]CAH1198647.1 thiamine monophosphate kinase [Candidatus Nitrotoga sp. BS]